MDKQQLAKRIWESANVMRSKIEANEYKDYILGFIFYKFLSDQVVQLMQNSGAEPDELRVKRQNVCLFGVSCGLAILCV